MSNNLSDSIQGLRGRGRRPLVIAGLAVLLAAGGGWYYWQSTQGQETQNQPLIATVQLGDIENTITAAGSLQPFEFVDVGAQVSGQLQKLHVEVGDVVAAGQLLAEIDARVQESRVDASRASIEALEAQIEARKATLELAKANAERQERLMAADATSQLDYDNAVNNLVSAQSSLIQLEKQIQQSRSSLESDETQLEYSKIYAPRAGTVVSIEMNEGRTLNATQQAPTILRIADLTTMTVETEISEADIGSIRKGMEVYFTTLGGGNRRWYSQLRQILPTPTIENNVVLYTGLFDIDNGDGSLLSDMTAQVYFITSAARNVLTVPLGALSFKDVQPGQAGNTVAGVTTPGNDGGSPGGNGAGFGGGQGRGFPEGMTEEQRERIRERIASGQGFGGGGQGSFGNGGPGGRQAAAAPARRLATVSVASANGTFEERDVIVGITSRISAEIISGLEAGEQVVAGILQVGVNAGQNNGGNEFENRREMFRAMGGFRP